MIIKRRFYLYYYICYTLNGGIMNIKKTLFKVFLFIIIIIAIFVGNYFYNESNYFQKWLICDYNSEYKNYDEKIKFVYVDNVLYEYTREETMRPTESTTMEEILDLFYGEKEKLTDFLSKNFSYEVTEGNNEVKIKTYIKTIYYEDFYNSYIEGKGITMSSTIDEVEKKLGSEYTCKIKKVR